MSKRITKIKYKSPTVEIHTEEYLITSVKESVFKCTEEPHPDLKAAFAALVSHVYEILQLPSDAWPSLMTITGVSFSKHEETKIEGAVISGRVDIETCQAPFCFNTPHLPFEPYSEASEAQTMDADAIEALEKLREEAQAYMDGTKRAQMELAGVGQQ
ncbi:hypothetical protein EPO44_19675 [bacterium]|nr:MAG: hypothetical protein EPO44_19675 [bacterium]